MYHPNFISRKAIPIDLTKVERHEVSLGNLDLYLEDVCVGHDVHEYHAKFILEGAEQRYKTIKKWKSEKEAQREFGNIVTRIENGEYRLHVYSNGNVELKLLQPTNPV